MVAPLFPRGYTVETQMVIARKQPDGSVLKEKVTVRTVVDSEGRVVSHEEVNDG